MSLHYFWSMHLRCPFPYLLSPGLILPSYWLLFSCRLATMWGLPVWPLPCATLAACWLLSSEPPLPRSTPSLGLHCLV